MSRSKKKTPVYALNPPDVIRFGKKICRRKFRSISKSMLKSGREELMPQKMYEVSEIWEITDGKLYCPPALMDEDIRSVLRK